MKVPGAGDDTTLMGGWGGTLAQVTRIGSLLELGGRILKVQVPF